MRYTIPTLLLATILAAPLLAGEPKELQAARSSYEQASPHPTEADRERYITHLAEIRARLAANKASLDWQAVDAEIRRHPLPKNADSKALSQVLAGKWTSPRHDYVFRKDGTWSMLPAGGNTHGRWRIDGNRYFSSAADDPSATPPYTIILLTPKDFIYTDGKIVFYETRTTK